MMMMYLFEFFLYFISAIQKICTHYFDVYSYKNANQFN